MKKQNWNGDWKVWEMENSFSLIWSTPGDAEVVQLPRDEMIRHRAYAESAGGGNTGYRDGGHFCYSKLLETGEGYEKYVLAFDGVYENAAVYVNGQLACRHPYGYTRFYVDLGPYLETGKSNEIRVMTNNTAPSSRWYSGGGIYRDVCLFTSESPVYIAPDGVRIKTVKLDPQRDCAEIEVSTRIKNETKEEKTLRLRTSVAGTGHTDVTPVSVGANEEKTVVQTLEISAPSVWDEDHPQLYFCGSALLAEGEKVCDSEETRFGIRLLELDPARGLQVNKRSVKLRGACIHNDNGIIGSAGFKDAEYRKVKKLKQAGFNALRIAHHPASTALLDVCDELGMYVMNESFDMWTRNKTDYDYASYFNDWWERDIESMVASSYNHPSVVMYSVGNEIPEIGTPHGIRICRQLSDKVKMLDDTRYTTVAVNGIFSVGDIVTDIVKDVLAEDGDMDGAPAGNVNEFLTLMDQNVDKIVVNGRITERLDRAADSVDICGYNYMVARYEEDVKNNPQRVIVGSETYPPEISRIWRLVKKYPQIVGDFTWTGWDYIGEAGVGVPAYRFGEGGFGAQFPCQLAYAGDIDITGFRRPASYYREIVFGLRTDPYIAVCDPRHYNDNLIKTPWVLTAGEAKWDYPGMEGKPVRIEVYSPGDETELFLNGKSLGRKEAGEKAAHKAFYETVYEEGTLTAVSYQNGEKCGEFALRTPGKNARLHVVPEKGDMAELAYVDIELRDEEGVLVQSRPEKISVSVTGALESWLGTGNPKPAEHYPDLEAVLWNGRAQLVVRKRKKDDPVSVTVSSEIGSVSLQI